MLGSVLTRRPIASFVGLTFTFSWSVWVGVAQLQVAVPVRFAAQILAGFGPAIAAAVMIVASGNSLRSWIRDMARWRVPKRWYLVALGLPIGIAVFETVAYAVFVGPLNPSALPQRIGIWVGTFVLALLLTGGNEELGWRGFMQPRLQRSYSAFTAALLVGVVWTVWHLPMHVFLPELGGGFDMTTLLSRAVTVPLAVIYAWLYNETEGSVILAMLFHAGWNNSQLFVPAPVPEGAAMVDSSVVVPVWGARVVAVLLLLGIIVAVHGTESVAGKDRHTQSEIFQLGE